MLSHYITANASPYIATAVLCIVVGFFLGLYAWVANPRKQKDFADYSNLPFEERGAS